MRSGWARPPPTGMTTTTGTMAMNPDPLAGAGGHGGRRRPAHDHDHGAARATSRRRLAWTLALVVLYMAAEVVGSLLTNSLALLADAGHMLSDAGSLALALFALAVAARPATAQRTYGYHRIEILAALAHGATLVAIALFVVVEAVGRLAAPPEVAAPGLVAVAAGGLLVNLVGLALLHGGREASLNVRGAWLHVLTDALGSVQAMVAGGLIWLFGWRWADPVASLAIAVLVAWSAWSLLKEAVAVLMEWAPGHIDVDRVRASLRQVPGVLEVHDLHVWTITSGLDALSCHVIARDRAQPVLLREIRTILRQRFGIDHVTVQVEPEEYEGCRGC